MLAEQRPFYVWKNPIIMRLEMALAFLFMTTIRRNLHRTAWFHLYLNC